MDTPQTRTVAGQVVDFTLLCWGPEEAPLAVLLHGYPDSPHSWQGVAPHLVDAGYRVVAPWTRGYAPTSVPADGSFHIGALASDAIELHALLGGDDRAVLVGHDWGAVAAHAVAGLADQPYSRVVAMSVPPVAAFLDRSAGTGAWLLRLVRQARMSWYVGLQQVPVLSEWLLPRLVPLLWRRWSPHLDPTRELPAAWEAIGSRRTEVLSYYRHAARGRSVPAVYREQQRAVTNLPTVPMLYLHGVDDRCVLPAWLEPTSSVLPPGSHAAAVTGAGHFLQAERPDEVAALIIAFVAPADADTT